MKISLASLRKAESVHKCVLPRFLSSLTLRLRLCPLLSLSLSIGFTLCSSSLQSQICHSFCCPFGSLWCLPFQASFCHQNPVHLSLHWIHWSLYMCSVLLPCSHLSSNQSLERFPASSIPESANEENHHLVHNVLKFYEALLPLFLYLLLITIP